MALRSAKLQNLRLIAITGHNEALAQKLRQHFVAKNQASNNILNNATPENSGRYQQDTAIEIYGFRDDVPQMRRKRQSDSRHMSYGSHGSCHADT